MTERQNFDIPDLLKQMPQSSYHKLGDDFFIAKLGYNESLEFMKYPVRFNGFLAFFCIEGSFSLDINLKSYEVSEGSLIVYTPGNIAKVAAMDQSELSKLQFVLVASTEAFITGVRMDFSKLYEDSLLALENPCIRLDDAERGLLRQYLDLAETLLSLDIPNKAEAVKSLGTSIFYLLGTMWRNQLDVAHQELPARTKRSNAMFENFLKLVADHHRKEHGIKFYADMLLLTPKYLSKFIKEVSGRTAPEWIDSFIILDAKNLLKYSDMSIKEIAYNMHFSSVPAFYKFFQKKTGMTPAVYRSA
ncbi:MAG: helix-turn-helix transcriptional regulator [Bacteroidales bacterium]|nr:helix-turn-helix transcriptional regulator [Candidatus Cryptobacteroides choladohippi]MCQ2180404.1 helix-turn-helix transcriptional regulator [Bacteroidales bacterium]